MEADDDVVSLEKKIEGLSQKVESKRAVVDELNKQISAKLQILQRHFSKDDLADIQGLIELEKEEEEKYLDSRKAYYAKLALWRSKVIIILKSGNKTAIQQSLSGSALLSSSQYLRRTMSMADAGGALHDDFGTWEIDNDEIKFKSSDCIGSGTFGTVYKGTCRGKKVAVKVLRKQNFNQKVIEDFKRECSVMSKLKHPNILLFMGACTIAGKLKIVTEVAENGSVEDVLKDKSRKLSFHRKMMIAKDTAAGMTWLHCMNPVLLHLDLKPANLLLMADWSVKIADFGLCTVLDTQKGSQITASGTPVYMAPEMFLNDPKPSKKCDVFAFGIILWELISELVPYEGQYSNVHQLVGAIMERDVRPSIPRYCPSKLENLIMKCWSKNPAGRPEFKSLLDISIFDDIILQAVTMGNSECTRMWKGFGEGVGSVPWNHFLTAFCKVIKVNKSPLDPLFISLKWVLDVDKKPEQGKVTLEAFKRFLQWFGPITAGTVVLEHIHQLLSQKWFHGVKSAADAETDLRRFHKKRGKKCKGGFLVRFSSRGTGSFTITFSNRKDGKILHYRVPDQHKYDLMGFVRTFKKKKKLGDPVPSPYEEHLEEAERAVLYLGEGSGGAQSLTQVDMPKIEMIL